MNICKYALIKRVLIIPAILFVACIEPTKPEFDFLTGLVTVEAIISNEEGTSFVRIQESELSPAFNIETYLNTPVNNAQVTFINTNTLDVVNLTEGIDGEVYLPPANFKALIGDTWELDIKLPDGRHYKSLPETLKTPVQIDAIEAVYNPELEFVSETNRLLPGHSINVTFNDPSNEKNYYYWTFKSFEPKRVCLICTDSYYRNEVCDNFNGFFPTPNQLEPFHITYLCEVECWRIRHTQNIEILDDEFVNGLTLNQIPVANILLYTRENILVELSQCSISQSAYRYYKTVKDIIKNNGGLNATPPAALVGNLYNVNEENEYVLGRFTATSTLRTDIFIDRTTIQEDPLEMQGNNPENENQGTPPGIPAVYVAPCVETFYSTAIKPDNWPN